MEEGKKKTKEEKVKKKEYTYTIANQIIKLRVWRKTKGANKTESHEEE